MSTRNVPLCLSSVTPRAALKDDLIRSFEAQLRGRQDELASMSAELSACCDRLAESESLLERYNAATCCCSFSLGYHTSYILAVRVPRCKKPPC